MQSDIWVMKVGGGVNADNSLKKTKHEWTLKQLKQNKISRNQLEMKLHQKKKMYLW